MPTPLGEGEVNLTNFLKVSGSRVSKYGFTQPVILLFTPLQVSVIYFCRRDVAMSHRSPKSDQRSSVVLLAV